MGPPKAKPQKAWAQEVYRRKLWEEGSPVSVCRGCKVGGESKRKMGGSHGGERGSKGSAGHTRVVRFSPAA